MTSIAAVWLTANPSPLAGRTAERPQTRADASPRPAPATGLAPERLLLAPLLMIEFDAEAERFVQTLVDAADQSVLRRHPGEAQLAFSRGVNAYMAAVSRV